MLINKRRGSLAPTSLIQLSGGYIAADRLSPGDSVISVMGSNHSTVDVEITDSFHSCHQRLFMVTTRDKTIKVTAGIKFLSFIKKGKYYQNDFLSLRELHVGDLVAVVCNKHVSFTAISEIIYFGKKDSISLFVNESSGNNFIADGFVVRS